MNQQAMSSVAVAADFAGRGVVDVEAVDLDRERPSPAVEDVDVGLAEDGEQVAFAGLLEQLVGHREVGVHPGGQDGQLAEAHRLAGRLVGEGIEGEAAHDEDVEVAAGLQGGLADEVRPDGPVLRPDGGDRRLGGGARGLGRGAGDASRSARLQRGSAAARVASPSMCQGACARTAQLPRPSETHRARSADQVLPPRGRAPRRGSDVA